MAWFDDAAVYYTAPQGPITQGDILLAPTTTLFPGHADEGVVGPSSAGEHRESNIWLSNEKPFPSAPEIKARTLWSLAVVIPHACSMEKEWNERIAVLKGSGQSQQDAEAQANAETELDPFVSIAPIALYDSVGAEIHNGIRNNQRLGNFPVCQHGNVPEGFADFNRIATIHHTLAPLHSRVAALSVLALAHMQHALAMHFAYRSHTGLQKIEAAVGSTIDDIAVTNRAKGRVVVNLILSNGTTMTLEGQPEAAATVPAADRPPRN